MKNMRLLSVLLLIIMTGACHEEGKRDKSRDIDNNMDRNELYVNNRAPLRANEFVLLPIGAIQPEGWLREQLERMATGATGNLDHVWEDKRRGDVSAKSAWLGGDGDPWERGPYWLDGLVPLAYILQNDTLIAKANKWIEWTLSSQREDGYFGPDPDKGSIFPRGVKDWWPRMVMLKVMQSYYDATQDERVISFMSNYFEYQMKLLPDSSLGTWTDWAEYRGMDNLQAVYWLYNHTGDEKLLQLSQMIHEQTFDWQNRFLQGWYDTIPNMDKHGVNISMGIKAPAIYYQQSMNPALIDAVDAGLAKLDRYHGHPGGMFTGDEWVHGTDPTHGVEFCSVVETMYSLQHLIRITGSLKYADRMEKIAYNLLPAQSTPDFTGRQYFQCANQPVCDKQWHNFHTPHGDHDDLIFGLTSGYGCCTANMHQGWPKLVRNLWYATPDNGLAAIIYAPSSITAKVDEGAEVSFKEETEYPFRESVKFTCQKADDVSFALYVRIPAWCKSAEIKVNGKTIDQPAAGTLAKVEKTWRKGDEVELLLPMTVDHELGHEKSAVFTRGPLVYALGLSENWKVVEGTGRFAERQVTSNDPWNYGVKYDYFEHSDSLVGVEYTEAKGYPWTIEKTPVKLKLEGHRLPMWKLYNGMCGQMPVLTCCHWAAQLPAPEQIELVPYGCTRLRISELPLVLY